MNDLGDVAWFLAGVPLGLAALFACLYGHELLFLTFWGACVFCGSATAVGLVAAGMDHQDAVNTGLALAFLPALVGGAVALILWIKDV